MYGQNLKRIEHADGVQIAVTDFGIDHLELNVEHAREETEEREKWILEGLHPSECNDNGETYVEFEVDGQKLPFDSQDSDDDKISNRDHSSGPHVGITGSRTPNSNEEEGLSVSEPQWLQKDEALAVWVKWRGQWQPGIRCPRADWPLPTLRAKPTHDRKKYIVIFFPRTRNYSWADVLFVRPIDDFPQPIAYKTHKVGMKMVKDLTLACRFIMQKIAVNILSVLDQLQSEALIEAARNVMAWKEFAMEASRCQVYSDLGKILLKLQNMILPSCISLQWLEHSLPTWVERCQNANSAESIELLKEELVDSISWDEVNSRSHGAAQHELSSEWKSWKQEVMKWFSMSNFSSSGGDAEESYNDNTLSAETQMNRKRPKLEVRRADAHASQVVHSLNQNVSSEFDAVFFNGDGVDHTLPSEVSKDMPSVKKSGPTASPVCVADGWGKIVIETGDFDCNQTEDVEFTPENRAVIRKPTNAITKNRQCIAFIESKGRKCVRWANEGDVYCCVHLTSRYSGSSSKAEVTVAGDLPMCEGTTVLGSKCKHRSLPGSSFCKKHRPRDDRELTSGSLVNNLKRRHEYTDLMLDSTNCKEIVIAGQVETPLQAEPITTVGREASSGSYPVDLPDQLQGECNGDEVALCTGLWPQDGCEPCHNSPKWHSLYCEKHIPSWLKRARNGRSRIISKEVFVELLKNCHSREQKLNLHKACELFYRLFKSIQSFRNPVPKEVQFQWALSEAAKDVRVGESLLKLVTSEKGRLERLWGFNINENVQSLNSFEEPVTVPSAIDGDDQSIIKCKLCSEIFSDDHKLGSHWMDHHKKEAQWLFRGYVCAICLDSFTNRKVLENHVQERHRVEFVEQCMLFQCITCSSHFGNPEQLWSHVLSVHSADLKISNTSECSNVSMMIDDVQNSELNKSALVEHVNSESHSTVRKFFCRFCGLRFDLLPDLGRHHQAAHMGSVPMGPCLPKRGLRFYAQKLKSGRLTRPGFKKVFGSAAYRIRNRNAHGIKKHMQSTDFAYTAKMKLQPNVLDTAHLGRLADSQCSAIAKVLFSEIKRTKPRPSNLEILSIARSTCCKVSLLASLEAKYRILPQRIYLKAAKLCSEQNILVNWHQEGFVCPRGCSQIVNSGQLSPLSSLSDNLIAPRCSIPTTPVTSEWEMDESHYVIDSRHFNQDAAERIILCDDITFGKESIPIACVVDETLLGSLNILADGPEDHIMTDSLPWEGFTYITKPLFSQSLDLEVESSQLGCACAYSICSPATCDHVYLFDNDYEDAKDIYGKPIRGRFPYDERGRIILEEGYLVYECNQMCRCSKGCQNRILQNGVRVKLEIFKTDKKGWAVRSRQAILRGTFVCEYIGEVIDETEAAERRNRYGNEGCNYIYEVDAQINDISRLIEGQVPFVIDATNYGNVSRYINHSCSPNLVNHQVIVERMDCQLAHIGLFASRDIAMGEELTYDYQYKLLGGEGIPCLCGASNCRGRLY